MTATEKKQFQNELKEVLKKYNQDEYIVICKGNDEGLDYVEIISMYNVMPFTLLNVIAQVSKSVLQQNQM